MRQSNPKFVEWIKGYEVISDYDMEIKAGEIPYKYRDQVYLPQKEAEVIIFRVEK